MKALVYEGPRRLALRNVEAPAVSAGEVRVKVEACGVCGSDMHAFHGQDERRPAPLILGHEVAGVAESGSFEGRRVAVNPLVVCGECAYCRGGRENLCVKREILSMPPRQGGFAERICVPEENLVEIGENGPPAAIACLVEPLATSYHVLRGVRESMAEAFADPRFLILGGGAIGAGCLETLLALGISKERLVLTEKNPLRLKKLAGIFPCRICDPSKLSHEESSFSAVIDAVGNEATHRLASFAVAPGGIVARVGLELSDRGFDVRKFTLREIKLIGSYTYTRKDFKKTASLLFERRLDPSPWHDVLPLDEGAEAFARLDSGRVPFPKIVLRV